MKYGPAARAGSELRSGNPVVSRAGTLRDDSAPGRAAFLRLDRFPRKNYAARVKYLDELLAESMLSGERVTSWCGKVGV